MTFNPAQANHFVELLTQRAAIHPQRTALHCLGDAPSDNGSYSFAELDSRARAMAAQLQQTASNGDRALILLHSSIDYVSAFFGCLYAGVIAVPAYPPESMTAQHIKRVASILDNAKPTVILTHSSLVESITRTLAAMPGIQSPQILVVDSVDVRLADDWRMPIIANDGIAFLQYTSGSTATPKGVKVGHDNLLANQRAIKQGFAIGDDDVFVSWLPLYHDMGLVGSLLQPLYSGIPLALMSPRYFLERPVRWLEAVARFGGTISGGPDFAFRLCNERISEAQLEGLRLDSWRLAFCGAEPIRYSTLTTFAEKFAAIGLPSNAPYPCYGLAEATLLVSGGSPAQAARALIGDVQALAENRLQIADGGVVLVDCGQEQDGHDVAIVDPASDLVLSDGQIGEIRFAGPSVTHGYWQNSQATSETFVVASGKTWLHTGDLGFIYQGSLFITGRSKDLILIRGQNLYPQDIEQSLEEQIELLRKGRVAAFAVASDGCEGIGIAAEIGRGTQKLIPATNLFEAINEVVALSCQEPAALILLLNPGALPKTSSGKLQRCACRQGWLDGSLDYYAVQQGGQTTAIATVTAKLNVVERQVAAIWCEVLGINAVAPQQSFFALGGQSITAVQVISCLREQLGVTVEPRLFFEVPSLRDFSAVIEKAIAEADHDAAIAIPRLTETDDLTVSYGQESLWFLAQLDPCSTAYHIAGGVRISGALVLDALQQAFNGLAARHDALRSVFYAVDGQPRQRIRAPMPVSVDYHDLSGLAA
ncbi:MAG: AMP-binding protein, partial [Methylovulum sp.]|nr:AMP-binding protein [Methylovulum sp.]